MCWRIIVLFAEIRYSLRNLSKAPGFTLTAILTLALGIGATTAIFTVVNSVLLRPLSYRDSGKLVVVWEKVKFLASSSIPYGGPNPRHEAFWREHTGAFSSLCLLGVGTSAVSLRADHPQLVGSVRTEPNLLDVLQVRPMLGRNFNARDAVKGHDHVAILAYSMWQRLFGGDPNAIGKTVRIRGDEYEVAGILPEDFRFPKRNVLSSFPSRQAIATAPPVEVLIPAVIDPNGFGWNSDYGNWIAIGRLKPGVTARQAESDLDAVQRRIVREMFGPGENRQPDALLAYVQPMQEAMVGSTRRGLELLMAAVLGLVLIACVNLANAQLGRAVSRQRAAAVRSALGASTTQLLWGSLAESLILATAGGVAGVVLAFNALALFKAYAPVDLPRMAEIRPDLTVLAFACLVTVGSAVLFGILPALSLLRTDPQSALQDTLRNNDARTRGSRQDRRVGFVLIGLQVFGCTVLLSVTGLVAKSLSSILTQDRGFDSSNIVAAEVNLRTHAYAKDDQRNAFVQGVLRRLRTLPGVEAAAMVSAMPLEGETWIDGINRPDKRVQHEPLWNMRWVSAGYFELLRERLVAGRFLEERDRDTRNAVISASSAKAGWPGEDPVGRQFKWQDKAFTVVGVVADARTNSLKDAPVNMAYLPFQTNAPWESVLLVRSSRSAETLREEVRHAIWQQDPEVTIARVKTLESQVNDSLATERFQTFMLIGFAVAALSLAVLGVYGVLSYAVAGRVHEIGIRMALGATRGNIYALTMWEAAIPVCIGMGTGWAASVYAGELLRRMVAGVSATDRSVALTVTLVLIVFSALAAFFPARRAASVDPMQALRTE